MAVKNEIRAVGDFHLAEAKILTSAGNFINIKASNIGHIRLYEDIKRSSVSGEILIQNSAAFSNEGPIIGQEYLYLKIQTPSLERPEDIIDFSETVFLINSVQNRMEIGNNVEACLLTFTSSELSKNQRVRIKGSLEGSYSDIVKQMFDSVDCRKKIFIEPTKGVKRIVAPNISPFDVIQMAVDNASSNLTENFSPTYLFFETFKAYHFRSLSSLYSQPSVQDYTSLNAGRPQKAYSDLIEKELSNIIGYEIIDNNSSLYNYAAGVLGSKLIVHNIYSKSFQEYTYNYFDNFDNEKHITHYHGGSQNPIFSAVSIEKDGARGSDFPTRTYLASISQGETDANNTKENGTEPFSAPDPQNTIQERQSSMHQLEKGLLINITVYGNTVISAGDVVNIDVPLVSAFKTEKNRTSDRFYSGPFLIKRIVHDFDFRIKKHACTLTLVKDSLSEKLDGPKDQHEPKPDKKSVIVSQKNILYAMAGIKG